ncbi:hypothetical protein TNIN_492371 [Trichonephila inaurata madagascariensis]|uniref:Uncharacterized protein n=1 Tax=Trichonephila inaurata madagascariensis TaxID=2747483 RepID=A0A8X7BVZ5_9ARAC|nr:hypothetical protein TNIN_492371 [Trichonephila inaurata madagascariensis]
MPKEVKRGSHEKRSVGIKETKDYSFILKLRQKIENSIASCDHCILLYHKRTSPGGPVEPRMAVWCQQLIPSHTANSYVECVGSLRVVRRSTMLKTY